MVELDNFVASCRQATDNLLTSWEQAVRTHPDDKLLKQHCYNLQSLLQLARFYVCICNTRILNALMKVIGLLRQFRFPPCKTAQCHPFNK
jgi:ABC-type anion transport system duplicated permease subunit